MLLVVSGPSGVGKTSITRALLDRYDDAVFSVSATTRPKSEKEADGVDYHFLESSEFDRCVAAGDFLEHAVYAGNKYGTLRAPVEQAMRDGKIMILDIDVQGGRQIKQAMPDSFGVFILPPSDEDLLRRLRNRKREGEDVIQRRLGEAKREIADARAGGVYDAFVVNSDLEEAINEVITLVEHERQRREAMA